MAIDLLKNPFEEMVDLVAYSSHEDWLQKKQNLITGTDISVIGEVNPYKSPAKLWEEKSLPLFPGEVESLPAKVGKNLESLVAEQFSEATGLQTRELNRILVSKEIKYFGGNIDRYIPELNTFLECKTTNAFNKDAWEDDNIPEMYKWQINWYAGLLGVPFSYVAVLIGNDTFKYHQVEFNAELFDKQKEKALIFYNQYLKTGIRPPESVIDEKEYKKYLILKDNTIDISKINNDITQYLYLQNKIKEIKDGLKPLEKEFKNLEFNILLSMGENNHGTSDLYDLTVKETTRKIVDQGKVKALPNAEEFMTDSKSVSFKVKEI